MVESKRKGTVLPLRAARAQMSAPEIIVRAVYRSAIGIDVHLHLLVCTFQKQTDEGMEYVESRDFHTDRDSIDNFVAWVMACDPEIVLMESTGILWLSPYEALEAAGFSNSKLALINARDAKAAIGRKTDRKDAARLAELARSGHFKRSFVPPKVFREMRLIARDIQSNGRDMARALNRYQKLLNSCGCRASTVFSDVHGKAASIILEAKINEDPDLETVIRMNCRRLRASPKEIHAALNFAIPPAIAGQIREARKKIKALQEYDKRSLERLEALQKPYKAEIEQLKTIAGIQERAARLIFAELCQGKELKERFSTSEHFASWLGICPGDNTSAGKQKSGKTPKGNKHLRRVLVECTKGFVATKAQQTVRDKFLALKLRRGHKRAVVATAHLIARIIYSILTKGKDYVAYKTTALRDVVVERARRSLRQLLQRDDVVITKDQVVEKDTGVILARLTVAS